MTEQELAALEAAAKAATPGKRRVIIDGTCSGATPRIVTEALDEFGEPFDIAELSTSHVETAEARESSEMPGSYDEKPHRFELTSDGEQILADADFMAKADPTTIQSLIAACRKARALALEEAAAHITRGNEQVRDNGWIDAANERARCAAAIRSLATTASIEPAKRPQDDSHVMPPFAAPASQHDATVSDVLDCLYKRVKEAQEASYTYGEYSKEAVEIALDGVLDLIENAEQNAASGSREGRDAQDTSVCASPAPSAKQEPSDLALIAHLIGIIFFAGVFKAETANERELESLLVKTGHRYASWAEIDAANESFAAPSASAAPAAPFKFTDEQQEKVRDALSATLGDAMDCTRVWSAWGVGTMSEDDFQLLADNDERLDELTAAVEAALAPTLTQGAQTGEEA